MKISSFLAILSQRWQEKLKIKTLRCGILFAIIATESYERGLESQRKYAFCVPNH